MTLNNYRSLRISCAANGEEVPPLIEDIILDILRKNSSELKLESIVEEIHRITDVDEVQLRGFVCNFLRRMARMGRVAHSRQEYWKLIF